MAAAAANAGSADFDFLALLLPDAGSPTQPGAPADPAPADLALSPVPVAPADAGQLAAALARSQKRFAGPRRRSAADHYAIAARMREGKARKRLTAVVEGQAESIAALVEPVRQQCRGVDIKVVRPSCLGGSRATRSTSLQVVLKTTDKLCRFTTPQQLEVAYAFGSTNAVARQWSCDAHTVRRLRIRVAQTYLCAQSQVLELAKLCLNTRGGVLWASCLTKWDETSEKLCLRVCSYATLQQQRSSWHVMVVRMKLAWGLDNGLVQSAEVVCPVLPLVTTSAEHLHAALTAHPHTQAVNEFKNFIFNLAGVALDVYEADAASANDRLYHYLLAKAAANTLTTLSLCRNHQNHLVQASLVANLGLRVVNDLLCATLFLRMGGHFLRLICALQLIFQPATVQIIPGQPPPDAQEFAEEFHDFMLRAREWLALRREKPKRGASRGAGMNGAQQCSESECHAATAPPSHRPSKTFLAGLKEFCAVFNGRMWENSFSHHCMGAACCSSGPSTTCNRMIRAVSQVLLARVPEVPALSKWTNLGCCVDNFAALILVHNVLGVLFASAFCKMRAHKDKQLISDDGNLDWHAVEGVRLARSRSAVESREWRACVVMLSVLLEPLRLLSRFFMHCSTSTHCSCKIPHLCDLVTDELSPVVVVMQYLAGLLIQSGGRLLLVLRSVERRTVSDFIQGERELAARFRRALLLTAGETYRRHGKHFRSWPWKLASLVDPRVAFSKKQAVADMFVASQVCCLPCGMARKLGEMRLSSQDLLGSLWQGIIWNWCIAISLSIADVEQKHARNRRTANPNSSWANFSAMYANMEATDIHYARARAGRASVPDSVLLPGKPPEPQKSGHGGKTRRPSAFLLHKKDVIAQKTAAHQKFHPASTGFWQELKQSWQDMKPERKASFQLEAELSHPQLKPTEQQPGEQQPVLALADAGPGPASTAAFAAADERHDGFQQPVRSSSCSVLACVDGSSAVSVRAALEAGKKRAPLPKVEQLSSQLATARQGAGASNRRHPLAGLVFDRHVARGGCCGSQLLAEHTWQKTSNVKVPESNLGKVEYPEHCPEICFEDSPAIETDMYSKLLAVMLNLVESNGGAKNTLGIVLVFELFDDMFCQASQRCFVELISAISAHGRFQAEQVFSILEVVEGHVDYPYNRGVTLANTTRPYRAPSGALESPFSRTRCGELQVATCGELARLLLKRLRTCPEQIIVRVLQVGMHPQHLHMLIVTGVDEATPAQFVVAGDAAADGDECAGSSGGGAPDRGGRDSAASAGAGGPATDEPDFLSMLLQPAPSGQRPGNHRQPQRRPHTGKRPGAEPAVPMPDPATLEESSRSDPMDRELIAVLFDDPDAPELEALLQADVAEEPPKERRNPRKRKHQPDAPDAPDGPTEGGTRTIEMTESSASDSSVSSPSSSDADVGFEMPPASGSCSSSSSSGQPLDFDAWCLENGLVNRGNLCIWHRESNVEAGKLYFVWEGKHIQAVCRHHKACKTIITPGARAMACQRDLALWLARGASCTSAEHGDSAYELKMKYGMKPRAR